MMKMMSRFVLLLLFTVSVLPVTAQRLPKKPETQAFVLGVIEELYSKELGEQRTLNIYLPAEYDPNDTVRYPVVYLLDGSADEDFIHIAGLYQYNSFPWVARVAPSIVVGIANTNRKRDFTFPTNVAADSALAPGSGGSAAFMRFLEKELQPFIQSRYRTANQRTLIGQSLGGLLATEILFKKPELFDRYMIISPSLWWDAGSLLKTDSMALRNNFRRPTLVYLAVGKEGLTPTTPPRVMEVDANLLAEKLQGLGSSFLKVFFDYLPDEDHATIGHQAVVNALKVFARSGAK